jgi:hypothetical protein
MTSEVVDSENPDPVVGTSKQRLLDLLGPGLITGAADDDPSGIATYSQPVPGLCRFSFPAPPWRSTVEPNRELEPAFINIEPPRNELGYRWFTQRRNISQDHPDFVHAPPECYL